MGIEMRCFLWLIAGCILAGFIMYQFGYRSGFRDGFVRSTVTIKDNIIQDDHDLTK